MPITEEDIKIYTAKEYPRHGNYLKTVEIAEELQVHSRGIVPVHILDIDRPNENPRYKEYRKNKLIFAPKTKSKWGQISQTTDKIVMAEDWKINFPAKLPTVRDGESLEEYTTKDYPLFDSVVNWYFTVAKKKMEEDPNAVCVVFAEPTKDQTEYAKPRAYIYDSECIIDFKENEFCAVLLKEKSMITYNNQQVREGDIYMFFDRDTIIRAEQVGEQKERKFEYTITTHNIGEMPAFRLGGIIESFENNQIVYRSFYDAVLPDFNEAIARYSDHQVNMAMHLHPDRWEMATSTCKVCNGNGTVSNKNNTKTGCTSCNGAGMVSVKSPFGVTTINPAVKTNATDSISIPTPPMGYATRPIESLDFLKKECQDLIQSGFDSINMGFLNEEPAVNSGIAKTYDRQELNAFFRNISRHIVENNLKPIFYFINEFRYPLEKKREDQLPEINVPKKFDILSADIVAQRLNTAITGKFNPIILGALQIEYTENEFGKDSVEAKKIRAVCQLDPLPGLNVAEKNELMVNSSMAGTDYDSYVLSVNIYAFIERAIEENEDFLDMDYSEKKKIVDSYVQEITSKKTANIVPLVNADGGQAA